MKTQAIYAPALNLYQQQLKYIALALCCTGVLLLLAANWFYFPRFVQLYLPQALLLISCILAAIFNPMNIKGAAAAVCAAVMTGLCLSSYGQVYQTGADSYQLFLTWSIFLIPWLFYRLSVVYVLFCITSALTIYLISAQMLYLPPNMLVILATLISLAQIFIAQLYFKGARLVILLPIAIFSIVSAVMFTIAYFSNSYNDEDYHIYWWLSAFVLPLILAGWFYFKKWPAGLATTILVLTICTTIHLVASIIENLESVSSFTTIGFTVAILVFTWCLGISFILKLLLPKVENLSSMPIAFGSWISSIVLFSTLFYGLKLDFKLAYIFLILATIGLRFSHLLFLRQISYVAILCSQLAIFEDLSVLGYSGYTELDNIVGIPIVAIVQIAIVLSTWFVTKNQFWRSLQLSILMIILYNVWNIAYVYIIPLGFIILIIFPTKVSDKSWLRPIIVTLFVCVLIKVYQMSTLFFSYEIYHPWKKILFNSFFDKIKLYNGLYLLMGAGALYRFKDSLNLGLIVIFTLLTITLIWCSQYYLLLMLAALLIICLQKDYFLLSCFMLILAIYLTNLYYTLSISFMIKGSVLLVVGVLLSVIAIFISSQLRVEDNK